MATKFKDFMLEVEQEARAEGHEAVAHLESLRADFRLGRQIYAGRKAMNLTQGQVAKRAGIDQGDLSRIEHGFGNPTLRTLNAVVDAVEMELHLAPRKTPRPKPVRKTGSKNKQGTRTRSRVRV